MTNTINKRFAQLFKKYRLRSEIETLAEFGDLLAQEGIVYENSIFTRWQNGERVPSDRKVILAILKIFVGHNGIQNIEQANLFLDTLDKRPLSITDCKNLNIYFHSIKNETVPEDLQYFIGRENLVKDISWDLINKRKVLVYGMPGIGKSVLGIHIANILRNSFSEGVFWYRIDIKDPHIVIDDLLKAFNHEIPASMDIDEKLHKITQLIRSKSILLILDNVCLPDLKSDIIKYLFQLPISIICTSVQSIEIEGFKKIHLKSYTDREFITLANYILGTPFVEINKVIIMNLGKSLEFLPLTTSLVLKRILQNPQDFINIIKNIQNSSNDLHMYKYDNKDLYSTLSYVFNTLSKDQKKILRTCALFDGSDFNTSTMPVVTGLSTIHIRKVIYEVNNLSLIEKSSNSRYRIHSVIKKFLLNKVNIKDYDKLVDYYLKKLSKFTIGSEKYLKYLSEEIDNVVGLIIRCHKNKDFIQVTKIWAYITPYIFYSGKWYLMYDCNDLVQDSYKKINDMRGLSYYLMEDMARIYFYQQKMEKVNSIFKKVDYFANVTKDKVLMGLLKQKLGIVHYFMGNFDSSESFFEESIKLFKSKDSEKYLIKTYAYLGMVKVRRKDYKKAKILLKIAEEHVKIIGDDTVFAYILNYLGDVYTNEESYKIAHNYYEKAYAIQKRLKIKQGEAITLLGLGILFSKEKSLLQARKVLKKSLAIFKELDMNNEIILISNLLNNLS